jgi:hypothetical protein
VALIAVTFEHIIDMLMIFRWTLKKAETLFLYLLNKFDENFGFMTESLINNKFLNTANRCHLIL